MRCSIWLSTLVPVALVAAGSAGAGTIEVPADFTTIQAALDAAVAGDTVLVAVGTYDDLHYPPGADTTQCVAYMKSGVTLRGAGQGQTVIDALDGGRGIYCLGVTDARIESLTVTRAFAQTYGAGIYCTQGSSPAISDCEITACGDGGIICTVGSSPSISGCNLTDNVAKVGGGLAMESVSSPIVTHCTITGNSAPVAGGVYVKGSSAPVFEHCTIDDNFLTTINGVGGGIAATNSLLTLRNCSVNGNVATGAGGGIHLTEVYPAVIESTTVQNNTTSAGDDASGGGIYCELADIELDHCTITGNRATGTGADGGGIFLFFASASTITNCTIADNVTVSSPDSLGAGISCFAFASPVIENTIIAFNGPGRGLYCADGTSVPTVACSDIYGNEDGDAICGTDLGGNFSEDPRFCNLAAEDFALDWASPCLPGNHPTGAPCGQIGARGEGCQITGAPEIGSGPADLLVTGPHVSPNPFRNHGTIRFEIARPSRASLSIYDVQGRRVKLLVDDRVLGAGPHAFQWDGKDDVGQEVSSGVYFCRLGVGSSRQVGRIVLRR